jgi:hypothetical protein
MQNFWIKSVITYRQTAFFRFLPLIDICVSHTIHNYSGHFCKKINPTQTNRTINTYTCRTIDTYSRRLINTYGRRLIDTYSRRLIDTYIDHTIQNYSEHFYKN